MAMYQYWVPEAVEIHVYPHNVQYNANSASTGGRDVMLLPWATIQDLEPDMPFSFSGCAAKGAKAFSLHPAGRPFKVKRDGLERLCA